MTRRRFRVSVIGLVSLALIFGVQIGAGGFAANGARAQDVTWSCAPATPGAAATPTATTAATPVAPAAFPSGGGNLTVFAAASLTDAFNQMGKDLEAAHPGLKIAFNFAGSQQLVTQLTEGASADVLATANDAQMQSAVDGGVIDGTPRSFVSNRLALVVPKDNPAGVQSTADLAKDGLKLVLAAPAVPVGKYARASICEMGADTAGYGDGFVAKVAGNIVSEENNVKAVLTKVQLGEADAGIVYTTDVTKEVAKDVMLIDIPTSVNVVATYPIAPVKGGHGDLARAFIAYVLSPDGQATLQQYGFQSPS